jgi:hypothetical protein
VPDDTSAKAAVEHFYGLIDSYQYRRAWALLPPQVQAESGGYAQWRAGYRANVSSKPTSVAIESINATKAVVAVDLRAIDIDVCTGEHVEQLFGGTWTLRPVGGHWQAQAISMDKISGGTPALSGSECGGQAAPPSAPSGPECAPGYSECLDPNALDYDCLGNGGDGPEYVAGPIGVTGSDPFDLDGDSNGVGCE